VEASDTKSIKLPIVVRFFHPMKSSKIKLLGKHLVRGETLDIIGYAIHISIKRYKMREEVNFCCDNTNMDFGGAFIRR
jgi:hypothetical protein